MSKNVVVPDEVYEKAAKMATERHVAVDDLIVSAIIDQIAAQEYIAQRAARSSEEAFQRALSRIPDVEPEESDRF